MRLSSVRNDFLNPAYRGKGEFIVDCPKRLSLAAFLLVICFGAPLLGVTDTELLRPWAPPLPAQTRHPIRLALLDPFPESALPTASGQFRFSVQLEYSSIFLWERGRTIPPGAEGLEMVQLDSELALTQLRFEWHPASIGFRLGAQIGLLHYSAGFMDDELSAYHQALALPNLGKEDQPSDRFRATLQSATGEVAWQSESGGARFGNVQLWGGYPFGPFDLGDWTVGVMPRVQAKLPTGDAAYGLSAAGFDFSVGGAVSARTGSIGIDGNLDWVVPGEFDFRGVSGFGVRKHVKATLAGQWEAWDDIWLHLQFSGATPVFRTPRALRTMSEGPLSVSFGVTFALPVGELQLGMNEDLSYSEVDFAIFASWSISF